MSIRKHLGVKAAVTILAIGGLGMGLIGSGVAATFTSSGTATANVAVGTLSMSLSAPGGTVVGNAVTVNCPTIQSSAAGTCPLTVSVKNTGSMPFTLSVASSDGLLAPWSDMLAVPGPIPAPQVVAPGATAVFNGGIAWSVLSNSDLGAAKSLTYTFSASA